MLAKYSGGMFHLPVVKELELGHKKFLEKLSVELMMNFEENVFFLSFSSVSVLEEESPTALKNDLR